MSIRDDLLPDTDMYLHSTYEERTIDISLLVLDYRYIINYLRQAYNRINKVDYLYLLAKSSTLSSLHYMNDTNWTLNHSHVTPSQELFHRETMSFTQAEMFRSFHAYTNDVNYDYLSESSYAVEKLSWEGYAWHCSPRGNEETLNLIQERLFTIEDYMDNGTDPEQCPTQICNDCYFKGNCIAERNSSLFSQGEPPF